MATSQNDVKFLHFREVQTHGIVFDEDGPRRLTSINPRGGVTIAYRKNEDGTITYAPAMCSQKDNFERAAGRAISEMRLLNGSEYNHTTPFPVEERAFAEQLNFELGLGFGLTRKYSRNRKRKQAA